MASVPQILDSLNAAQKAAVTSASNVVQVLAPPGSGKTKTLTARVAYLVSQMGMQPSRIIVCTFTVKAAREMKERLTLILGEEVSRRLILGTFHSIALRLLATHGKHISLKQKFGIADSSDSKAIITRIIKRFGLTIEPKKAQNRISNLKSQGKDAQTFADECARTTKMRSSIGDTQSKQELVTVFSSYEEHLQTSNLLDYDDLLLKCGKLLREYPTCVEHIQAVLIDEFQDTNHIQFELMRGFSCARRVVTTVGDPDQSIYGWRSADITNLRKMKEQFPDLHVVNLEENYRSSGAILLAAQEIIEQDKNRPNKSLVPTHALGLPPVLRTLPNAAKEANWIVSEIKRTHSLSAGLVDFDDYAVLLRSAALSRLIEGALGKAGIPYRMVGGRRFFDRYEVKLVLDYLRVVDMTDNSDAVARVLNVPGRQIGDITLHKLLEEASSRRIPLWNLVKGIVQGSIIISSKAGAAEKSTNRKTDAISKQALKGMQAFFDLIHRARSKLHEESEETLVQYIQWLIRKIGLREHIKHKYADELDTRWANVEELISNAGESARGQQVDEELWPTSDSTAFMQPSDAPRSRVEILSSFLGNVALSTDAQAQEDESSNKCITISTIHAAKGLEWPIIFIPAVYDGSIPHSRAEDHDEELRLLYVAMTRAKVMLYISCPKKDTQASATKLSAFLSAPGVGGHFTQAGSSLKTQDIHEMSLVLRRPCPTARIIQAAKESTDPREDRKYLKESTTEDNLDYTDESAFESKKRKRPVEDTASREQYKSAAGFRSVASLVQEGTYSVSKTRIGTTLTTTSQTNKPAVSPVAILEKLRPPLQNNMKNYFKSTVSATGVLSAQPVAHPMPLQPMRLEIVQQNTQLPRACSAEHKLSTHREQSTNKSSKHVELSDSARRPAATMHRTTSTQLGTSSSRTPSLGIRRSMNGWENRKHK